MQRLEARVSDLQSQLEDPTLYAGGAEGARRAAKLDSELSRATKERDAALAKWADAVERLESQASRR